MGESEKTVASDQSNQTKTKNVVVLMTSHNYTNHKWVNMVEIDRHITSDDVIGKIGNGDNNINDLVVQ